MNKFMQVVSKGLKDITSPGLVMLLHGMRKFSKTHEIIKSRDSQSNTIQHNTTHPRQLFSKNKTASGGTRTRDTLRTRQMLYQLSYRGRSAGWGRIPHKQSNTRQSVSQPEEQANSNSLHLAVHTNVNM